MNLSEVKQLELDEAGQVLLRAAELIEQRGWCQNNYGHANGSVCVAVAISIATDTFPPDFKECFARLISVIGGGDGASASIVRWNDAPERTQAEVVAALRKAAWL